MPLEVAEAGRESSDAGGVAAGDLGGVLAPRMGMQAKVMHKPMGYKCILPIN